MGLPSRITTILQGESLVNDATAITAFKVALAAAVGEGATWAGGIGEFLIAAVGGVGVGLVLMVPLHWLRTHLTEALLQNTLSLLIPFVAYAVAEQVQASGVLAVVVVALYLGHRAWEVDFATRLQEEAVWKMVAFVLESAVFALIGLQLPVVLKGLGSTRVPTPPGTPSPSSWWSPWRGSCGCTRRPTCPGCRHGYARARASSPGRGRS